MNDIKCQFRLGASCCKIASHFYNYDNRLIWAQCKYCNDSYEPPNEFKKISKEEFINIQKSLILQ